MFEFLAQYPILSGVSSKQTETQKLKRKLKMVTKIENGKQQ